MIVSGCDETALELTFLPRPPKSDNLRVVLVDARNPLNIGAAARAMSNFGLLRLRVVNPYAVAFRKAKSAVGAAVLLVYVLIRLSDGGTEGPE